MNKEDLILKYKEELQVILDIFETKHIVNIPEKPYQWRAYAILNFIEDLKNLSNEPKVVRNNEQKEKKCQASRMTYENCEKDHCNGCSRFK